ncbi:4099_t:CDS:2, partial [Acaulospora colombiana]
MDALGSSDSIFKGSKRLEEESILAMEILGLEEALVPTELPEGPAQPSPRDGTLHEADAKIFAGVDSFSLPLSRSGRLNTELNPGTLRQPPAHVTSPRSASSNCSISSESSVIIIGDAFLAPTKLKSYLERNPNVTNSADLLSTPPVSPARRVDITRPPPTPPVQPQTNEPHSPVAGTPKGSGESSPVFQRFPGGTPKASIGGAKGSY